MSFRGIKPFTELIQEEFAKDKNDILLKIGFANQTYTAFIVNELTRILDEEIVQRIIDKMKSMGLSHKISDEVRIASSPKAKNPGLITWAIISDFKALNGFPVAVMIERGRRPYVIVPKTEAGVLSWVDKATGIRLFSKKNKIPRFNATKFVLNTIKERKANVQEKVNLATQRFVTDILTDTPMT